MPPRPGRPPRRPPRGEIRRRRAIAAGLLFLFLALALFFVFGLRSGGTDEEASEPVVTVAPKPTILRVVFPEGFTRKEMVRRGRSEERRVGKGGKCAGGR